MTSHVPGFTPSSISMFIQALDNPTSESQLLHLSGDDISPSRVLLATSNLFTQTTHSEFPVQAWHPWSTEEMSGIIITNLVL